MRFTHGCIKYQQLHMLKFVVISDLGLGFRVVISSQFLCALVGEVTEARIEPGRHPVETLELINLLHLIGSLFRDLKARKP